MAVVKLVDPLPGNRKTKTLDEVIVWLQQIREKLGRGDVPTSIVMEPVIDGEIHQIEDGLCDVAYTDKGVHILGRSFS